MATRKPTEEIVHERTTESVFSALGFPDAEEMERKSRLVTALNDTIEARGLTQLEVAKIVSMDQPTLSKLLRGRMRSVSTDKLTAMLNALGRSITIVVEEMPDSRPLEPGHTTVILPKTGT